MSTDLSRWSNAQLVALLAATWVALLGVISLMPGDVPPIALNIARASMGPCQ